MIYKCENLNAFIIQAAYKECSFFRCIQVKLHTRKCESCRYIYQEHLKLAAEFRNIKNVNCPENVLKNIERRIGIADIVQPTFLSDLGEIFSGITLKNLAASAMLIAAVTAGVIYIREPRPVTGISQKYSQAQIHKASVQAKESLALLGEILNTSTSKLEKDISQHVSRPLRKSIKLVNDLFEQEKTK